ncbi:PREDICTED: uncharacterized protein LOC109235293 [Nicotiana attenuata]|uniref:CCHC-type domain-containing protein n=1 Tax=Nicotiana attenuata TaxID=49451 RepID=A0A1J6HSC2_NICAT|nr:PREDICTED: uncharacterized protein LOC109235293 [Nicotiana attenuata]OIS95829.1 hypothetical protein A4A49_32327 [Nicotiana attenuata]
MSAALCSSFRVMLPQWRYCNKNLHYWILPPSKTKLNFLYFPIFSSFTDDDSVKPIKQNQVMYDPSEELFGLAADLQPRKVISSASSPRSWFGPNGQYIRELPCPSCRGRGYTPCIECGIERSSLDCSLCNGKGMMTCHQCGGDCVIWEESIDERPWEKARSSSPLKVKEDDEVDNLDIKLDSKRKTKRVYQSPNTEVNLKISRSLKSLNAKTGLFSKRMKIIHGDPTLHAQRVAAIKKAKGTPAARKRASDSMKDYFRDPDNRRKRSISMKGVKFYCRNCGQEGHRSNYCPEIRDNTDRRYRCRLCGAKGHNRRTCLKSSLIVPKKMVKINHHCSKCRRTGHNRRTCNQKKKETKVVATITTRAKRTYSCSVCLGKGHNARTCLHKNNFKRR